MNTGNTKKDARSRTKLRGVHPKLKAVLEGFARRPCARPTQFVVTEGLRTTDRQRELVIAGASKTMASKHLVGRAVDLAVVVDGEVRWDWPLYLQLGKDLKDYARAQDVEIVWGGDWASFPDGPHFELAAGE
tara:strand:+ start:644 stop:1039 length:396 start_codon:yes stop_codon:yes gene_type:complete